MMHDQMRNGLKQLGFLGGWAISGDKITLWQNDEAQPSVEEIMAAAKLWESKQQIEAEAKATEKFAARQSLLDKLGITADEAKLLLNE